MRKEKSLRQTYIESLVAQESLEMLAARSASVELGLEGISLSKAEASMMQVLAMAAFDGVPKKCVEIGTLTGLSALYWLKLMNDQGTLWSFEKSAAHFERSNLNLKKYVDNQQCRLILGDAIEELPKIESEGPFDFIFIDGNKSAYLNYWNWAEKNCAVGGLIFVDNVFLGGSVFGESSIIRFSEKQINIVRETNRVAYANSKFITTLIPTDEGLLFAKKIRP